MDSDLAQSFAEHGDDVLQLVAAIAPVLTDARVGVVLAIRTFVQFHQAGLPASLVLQSRPGHRGRDRLEASVVTGPTVQLALDFDALRTA